MTENSNRSGQGIKDDEKSNNPGFPAENSGFQSNQKHGPNSGRSGEGNDSAGNNPDGMSTEDRRKYDGSNTSSQGRGEEVKLDENDPSSEDANVITDVDKMRDDIPMSGQKQAGPKTGQGASTSTERRSGSD